MDRLDIRSIDICKVDVEGNELKTLLGAGAYLRAIKYIQFEFGGTMIDSRTFFKKIFDLLTEFDFKIRRITPLGLVEVFSYREDLERFEISNYAAINSKWQER